MIHRFQCRRASVLGVALAAIAIPAAAQENSANRDEDSRRLASLEECRQETAPDARLACYDREVAALLTATDAGELRILDQEDLRTTRRGLFGFSLPKIGLFSSDDDDGEELKQLQSTVTGVRQVGPREWYLTIEEGSVWSVRNPSRRFRPRVGDSVELERAALGSYWVRLNGQLGDKGQRVR